MWTEKKWRNRLVLYYLALNNYVVVLRPRATTDSTPVLTGVLSTVRPPVNLKVYRRMYCTCTSVEKSDIFRLIICVSDFFNTCARSLANLHTHIVI
jgi:hypothetical protein